MNSTDEKLMKITKQLSMAALAIDPRDPRAESVQLLRELNEEMEKAMDDTEKQDIAPENGERGGA